jgi:electron transfer flavoprotein alpha subunit
MAQDVLVVGELTDGALAATTIELLGLASRLADGGGVHATLLGTGAEAAAQAAFAQGATRAYVGSDAQYDVFRSDQWLASVEAALDAAQPAVVLIAQSMVGRDLAPRLAFRRGTAAAMDCLRVEMTGEGLRATRPAYGGNALATYSFATTPAVVTVRAKSQEPSPASAGASGEISGLPAPAASRTEVVSRDAAVGEGLQLQDAQIVVSGGRGLGAPEGFQLVESLADAFGRDRTAGGSSRAACDLGWYPPSQQVGLTGKVVSPDLYVAVGISGASQHMAGISSVKNIASINKDADASIFKASRWAVVHDWKEFIPAFIEEVKKVKAA